MEKKEILAGFGVVVVNRGFVYVGDVQMDSSFCVISGAKNIRRWGATKGLGQLAIEGPTPSTVLDEAGTVRIPMHAVVSVIDSETSKWPPQK